MLTAFHVDSLFYILLTLSTAVFLLLWLMRMTALLRQRNKADHYISIIIWTVTPAAIIIGLGLLGPSLVQNLQYLP